MDNACAVCVWASGGRSSVPSLDDEGSDMISPVSLKTLLILAPPPSLGAALKVREDTPLSPEPVIALSRLIALSELTKLIFS